MEGRQNGRGERSTVDNEEKGRRPSGVDCGGTAPVWLSVMVVGKRCREQTIQYPVRRRSRAYLSCRLVSNAAWSDVVCARGQDSPLFHHSDVPQF